MQEKKNTITEYIEAISGYVKARDKEGVESFCKSSESFRRLEKIANRDNSKKDNKIFLYLLSEADNFSEMLEFIKVKEQQLLTDKTEKASESSGIFSSLTSFFPFMANPDLDKEFGDDLPCLVREIANYARNNYFVVNNDLQPYLETHQLPENTSQIP